MKIKCLKKKKINLWIWYVNNVITIRITLVVLRPLLVIRPYNSFYPSLNEIRLVATEIYKIKFRNATKYLHQNRFHFVVKKIQIFTIRLPHWRGLPTIFVYPPWKTHAALRLKNYQIFETCCTCFSSRKSTIEWSGRWQPFDKCAWKPLFAKWKKNVTFLLLYFYTKNDGVEQKTPSNNKTGNRFPLAKRRRLRPPVKRIKMRIKQAQALGVLY